MITQEIHQHVNIQDGHLASTIIKPQQAQRLPAIIFLTGSGGIKERFQDIQYYFSAKGFYTLAFDFRGRGDSSGQPGQNTLRHQQFDVKHILSFLTHRQPIDPSDITLFGTSMGAFVAASIADEIPIKNLILSAPALYLPKHEQLPQSALDHKAKTIASQNQKIATTASSLQHLEKFTGNLLVLEHRQDDIIPDWLCQRYFDSAVNSNSKQYQLLKDVEHPILINKIWKQQLSETIYSWLKLIDQPSSPTP